MMTNSEIPFDKDDLLDNRPTVIIKTVTPEERQARIQRILKVMRRNLAELQKSRQSSTEDQCSTEAMSDIPVGEQLSFSFS